MTNFRDPVWYRAEAARLREKAAAVTDSAALSESYLALASEYERLARVLAMHAPTASAVGGDAVSALPSSSKSRCVAGAKPKKAQHSR